MPFFFSQEKILLEGKQHENLVESVLFILFAYELLSLLVAFHRVY